MYNASSSNKPVSAYWNRIEAPPGSIQCRVCGRFFNRDRIDKHQHVCRMSLSRRNVFNATKHRLKGTVAEKYFKTAPQRNTHFGNSATTSPSSSIPKRKNNWRKNHEEFITAIRDAKEVHTHLAKGGKLSELLPSIQPSENPDYIQCPHCSRKFNEAAADRHIPKCAKIMLTKKKIS